MIVQILLKAKHWQLFLAFMCLQVLAMLAIIPVFLNEPNPDDYARPLISTQGQWLFSFATILGASGFCAWLWFLGNGLQSSLPSGLSMKINWFRLSILIPLVYLIIYQLALIYGENLLNQPRLLNWVLPLHLLSMLCMVYNLYFVAKTLKTVELQRAVKFSEFLGEFFLVSFFPLGIWLIQPKVNQLVQENGKDQSF